jgi:hypothetical protein
MGDLLGTKTVMILDVANVINFVWEYPAWYTFTKNYGKIHHFSWENQRFLWAIFHRVSHTGSVGIRGQWMRKTH